MDGLSSSRSVDVSRGQVDRDKGDRGAEDRCCWTGLVWKQNKGMKEWRGTESDEKMMDKKKYGNSFSGYLISMHVID